MISIRNHTSLVLSMVYLALASCSDDKGSNPVPIPTIVKEWNIVLISEI